MTFNYAFYRKVSIAMHLFLFIAIVSGCAKKVDPCEFHKLSSDAAGYPVIKEASEICAPDSNLASNNKIIIFLNSYADQFADSKSEMLKNNRATDDQIEDFFFGISSSGSQKNGVYEIIFSQDIVYEHNSTNERTIKVNYIADYLARVFENRIFENTDTRFQLDGEGLKSRIFHSLLSGDVSKTSSEVGKIDSTNIKEILFFNPYFNANRVTKAPFVGAIKNSDENGLPDYSLDSIKSKALTTGDIIGKFYNKKADLPSFAESSAFPVFFDANSNISALGEFWLSYRKVDSNRVPRVVRKRFEDVAEHLVEGKKVKFSPSLFCSSDKIFESHRCFRLITKQLADFLILKSLIHNPEVVGVGEPITKTGNSFLELCGEKGGENNFKTVACADDTSVEEYPVFRSSFFSNVRIRMPSFPVLYGGQKAKIGKVPSDDKKKEPVPDQGKKPESYQIYFNVNSIERFKSTDGQNWECIEASTVRGGELVEDSVKNLSCFNPNKMNVSDYFHYVYLVMAAKFGDERAAATLYPINNIAY